MTTNDPTAGNPSPGEGDAANPNPTPEVQPATDAANSENGGQPNGEPAGDAGKQGGGTKAGDGQPQGAPEVYEGFTLPEGFKLEGERLTTATEFFKAKGWTQVQAQEAIDLYTRMAGEDAGSLTAALDAQKQQQIETWGQQARESLGDKYDETIDLARTAVKHVNDPELEEAFNTLGWGNHPSLIKAFAKFGESMRDSKVEGLGGGTATAGSQSAGDRMYSHAVDMRKTSG